MQSSTLWEANGVQLSFSQWVGAAELIEATMAVASDARFDEIRHLIFDLRAASGVALTGADLELLDASLRGPAISNPNVLVVFIEPEKAGAALLQTFSLNHEKAYPWVVCASLATARQEITKPRTPHFRPTHW